MRYRVQISKKAEADIDEALAWFWEQLAAEAGERWLVAIWNAIETLESQPDRFSLAAETEQFGLEVRELLFGKRRGVYRIIFHVGGQTVTILRIWHGSRNAIREIDL